MKRRIMVIFLLCVLTIGVTATYLLPQKRTEDDQTVHTLRVALWDYGTVSYDRRMIEQFTQEYPNIQVEVVSCSPEYYDSSLESMLDSGDRLDVIFVNQLPQLAKLIARDIALPLDDYAERDVIDLDVYPDTDVLRDPNTGALMGLPYRQDKFVLYYNKDLFEQSGCTIPENGMTWEEFADLAQTLTERLQKMQENRWGATLILEPKHILYYMSQHAFDWSQDDFQNFAAGLQLWLDMQDSGGIADIVGNQMRLDSQRMFETGRYAMFIQGSWYMNFLHMDAQSGQLDFSWGVIERPVWSEEQPNENDAWITPLIIHRNTTEPEAAWTFLKFVCGKQGAEILTDEWILPAYQDADIRAQLRQNMQAEGIDADIFLEGLSDPRPLPTQQELALSEQIYELYRRVLLGLDTVPEGVEKMEQTRQNWKNAG